MEMVDNIIQRIKEELDGLPGVVGIVLGGSRARGTHRPDSDIDIGVYYDESKGFNTKDIEKLALNLNCYHVYPIFRDIKRVSEVIHDCLSGVVSIHYQTGHPHGYLNAMYIGELAICHILSDPEGILAELKQKTKPYPGKLKKAIIQ